ncbi:Zinc-finger homeodomain protein [Melia azedarach]|uniref:Zinc-finger homeodomain protein n=1 Tax=Melia azedarach TaxID=155640 RepID=A0ACC1WPN1_MELAZ|nr:Zinc-finger homeodomain protein [Melia azedarach]
MDLSLVPYQHHHQQRREEDRVIKYKECMRNHAASIGGHANDGCGEFMPRSEDNSLTCAACGCHRNFHRREVPGELQPPFHLQQHSKALFLLNNPMNVVASSTFGGVVMDARYDDYDRRSETPDREEMNLNVGPRGRTTTAGSKSKRHRTKFTQEQKDKMLEFAEKIGWRIQRHDDVALNQFCNEVGVKRNVLKVWMHNNKSAHRRREGSTSRSPVSATAPAQPAGV